MELLVGKEADQEGIPDDHGALGDSGDDFGLLYGVCGRYRILGIAIPNITSVILCKPRVIRTTTRFLPHFHRRPDFWHTPEW